MKKEQDEFTRQWIIDNSVRVIRKYTPGDLTLRALHYQLVGLGMTNSMQHYKRVVAAMEVARWDGIVDFETFSDLERTMARETEADETDIEESIESGKRQVELWMDAHRKNRWENQPIYAEVFVEKKALQSIFARPCDKHDIGLAAVKGYPSLTFLHETAQRFKVKERQGKQCAILYFGDYDPSGEDIPRSIEENLKRMGVDVIVQREALFDFQVRLWNLPHAPTKTTDSRAANWTGFGQVELDAAIDYIPDLVDNAVDRIFNTDLHDALRDQEQSERQRYRDELKEFVNNLK